jgi:Phosphatidylinositol-specific phospholipase C, X domain
MVKPLLRGTRLFFKEDVVVSKLIVGMVAMVSLKLCMGTTLKNIVDGRHTAVEAISFRVVCEAIAKHAFVTTELPVIISLEVHCSIEQQQRMVEVSPFILF